MGSKKKPTSQKSSRSASPVKEICKSESLILEILHVLLGGGVGGGWAVTVESSYKTVMDRGYLQFLLHLNGLAAVASQKTTNGPHVKHVEEVLKYLQFGLWWVALKVASSIGLGSGLHTFVLYLGPSYCFLDT
ncbi:hypothetical protein HAX54_018493 [Datura stramonium]|uniref:Uncharacterized protein n=1 Tax=Datura stramonium TaxID=4076 RepID=A0ABS8UPL6_DATST|nr:hypothetical protein [Datura stramonium]